MNAVAMRETAATALAPARPGAAVPRAARRSVWASLLRRLSAALYAHARRQVALALGERVAELSQAITTGAETRRQLEREKENQQ